MNADFAAHIANHRNGFPHYSDLRFIADRRRTLIGTASDEIPNGRAYGLLRAGLVDYIHGQFGVELHLTAKGERNLEHGEEMFWAGI